MPLSDYQIWFLTGSQHLYGPEAIEQVGAHSREIAAYLNSLAAIPLRVVYKPVLTTPEDILNACSDANSDPNASAWSPGCIPSRPPRTGSPA